MDGDIKNDSYCTVSAEFKGMYGLDDPILVLLYRLFLKLFYEHRLFCSKGDL